VTLQSLPPSFYFLDNKFSTSIVWCNKLLFYGFELSLLEDFKTFTPTLFDTNKNYAIKINIKLSWYSLKYRHIFNTLAYFIFGLRTKAWGRGYPQPLLGTPLIMGSK